jgi:hypothetical protein
MLCFPIRFALLAATTATTSMCVLAQTPAPEEVKVDWSQVTTVSRTTPTLQVVVNPQLERGAKMHDGSFAVLRELGADYVRYVPWLPYPRLSVAELKPPTKDATFWDFSRIDPIMEDFMNATAGHSVVINFSTMPAWMFKTAKPVSYPDNPDEVYWHYTQGTEFRDPSMKEVADYYARLLSWYTKSGFVDELGKRHESGHHYKIAYWEVLNEIDLEHHLTPEQYAHFYDAVVTEMRAVDPDIKFMGISLAYPMQGPAMFEYFLNPANHKPGIPLDFITYHFYAQHAPQEQLDGWQYSFFDQADGFLATVRYIEEIRKRFSPATRTDINELGVILREDSMENAHPGYIGKPEPAGYYNLAGAMYAYMYVQLAMQGIDVVGESQLVGYHTQFPSVSMMDYNTSEPNPRLRVLQLLHENFGPGDKLVKTTNPNPGLFVQAFVTAKGKSILVVNKRDFKQQIELPANAAAGSIAMVAPSTKNRPPSIAKLEGRMLDLEPFEVAVVACK